jgi:hypothetical protein
MLSKETKDKLDYGAYQNILHYIEISNYIDQLEGKVAKLEIELAKWKDCRRIAEHKCIECAEKHEEALRALAMEMCLKPCPRCGSTAVETKPTIVPRYGRYIICSDCRYSSWACDSMINAARTWNSISREKILSDVQKYKRLIDRAQAIIADVCPGNSNSHIVDASLAIAYECRGLKEENAMLTKECKSFARIIGELRNELQKKSSEKESRNYLYDVIPKDPTKTSEVSNED